MTYKKKLRDNHYYNITSNFELLEDIGNMRFVLNLASLTKKGQQRPNKNNAEMKKNNNQTFRTQFQQISDHLTNRKRMYGNSHRNKFQKKWIH